MKTSRVVLLNVVVLLVAQSMLRGQAVVQGIVESRNMTTDETGRLQRYTMTLCVKGDMVRTEISAFGSNPPSTLIYRRDLGVVWVLSEKGKTFFEMRTNGSGQTGEGGELPSKPHIKRTGKSKRILGYPCDQLFLRNDDAQTEYWGTKNLSALAASIARAFGSDPGEPNGGMYDELARMGYYPMIVRTKLEGRLVESSEVTKINLHSLSDSLFVVPSEYRKELAPEMP